MVQYQRFLKEFWNVKYVPFDSLTVWTQINTYIKGHCKCFKFENRMLPLKKYLKIISEHKAFLDNEQKQSLWNIANKYEKWKNQNGYFDLMDYVNYLIFEINEVIKEKKFK